MKSFYYIPIILLILVSCSKEEPPAPGEKTNYPGSNPPPTGDDGELVIYRVDSCTISNTTVYLDGNFYGEFSGWFHYDQECSTFSTSLNSGKKTTMAAGTYTLTASTADGQNYWEGDVVVYENQCTKVELRCGGMMSGDAFTSINSTGSRNFYVDVNTCGSIAPVQIEVSNFNSYYLTYSWPADELDVNCEVQDGNGSVFTLPPGDYQLRADEMVDPFRYWETSFTIFDGDCLAQKLICN